MANTFTALFRGAASTSSATLYTVPATTKTLVTSITVAKTPLPLTRRLTLS